MNNTTSFAQLILHSDHLPVGASFQMSKINYSKLKDHLQQSIDWGEVLNANNVSSACERFIIKLKFLVTPKMSKEISAKHPRQTWMTSDLYQLTEKRGKLH